MREALERVFAEYGAAREQIFAGHELANYIRGPMAGEMRARRSWILLFPSLAILLTGAIAASAQPKILFVGDSITAGVGATNPSEGGFVAQIDGRFPELIAANAGCGGYVRLLGQLARCHHKERLSGFVRQLCRSMHRFAV